MFMADILSIDTVKLHKTEECIQIYNLNFLNFTFFFNKFFYYYYQGLVKPYLDLAESIVYLVFFKKRFIILQCFQSFRFFNV